LLTRHPASNAKPYVLCIGGKLNGMPRVLGSLQQARNKVRLEQPKPGRGLFHASEIRLMFGNSLCM